jgi:hypothetical protein
MIKFFDLDILPAIGVQTLVWAPKITLHPGLSDRFIGTPRLGVQTLVWAPKINLGLRQQWRCQVKKT